MLKNNQVLIYGIIAAIIIAALFFNGGLGRAGLAPLAGTTAYFPMEDLKDAITGSSLTNNGAATSYPGISGNGYKFDTIGQHLSFPTTNPGASFSLEAWVYPTTIKQGYIVAKVGSYVLQLRQINTTQTGTFQGGIYYSNSTTSQIWVPLVNSQIIYPGRWYHLVFTYDNVVGGKLYVNATRVSSFAYTQTPSPSTSPLTIGNRADYATFGDRGFVGIIDEVRIYNREITASEVTNLYQNPGNVIIQPPPQTQSYNGYFFETNTCTARTITAVASPYNATFLQTQSACQALIQQPQQNHYTGYELINNSCIYKEVDSLTSPYTATYKQNLQECSALIISPTTCASGTTLCIDGTCKASCGYTNITGFCTRAADCTMIKPVPNDCSLFWTPKNITITGTCDANRCAYPLAASVCTETELFLQDYKYVIIVAIIAILALVLLTRPRPGRR